MLYRSLLDCLSLSITIVMQNAQSLTSSILQWLFSFINYYYIAYENFSIPAYYSGCILSSLSCCYNGHTEGPVHAYYDCSVEASLLPVMVVIQRPLFLLIMIFKCLHSCWLLGLCRGLHVCPLWRQCRGILVCLLQLLYTGLHTCL